MGKQSWEANVDTLKFTAFEQFVGLVVGLSANGTHLKTLGALSDKCETTSLTNEILGKITGQGANPFNQIYSNTTRSPKTPTPLSPAIPNPPSNNAS